ncbi:hypothetical protein ACTFIZ_006075 [Dictyostelium cf. discoideum]
MGGTEVWENIGFIIIKTILHSSVNNEWKSIIHIIAIIIKFIISHLKPDGEKHGTISRNITHIITTIFQTILQYLDNPNNFFNDINNISVITISLLQDIYNIYGTLYIDIPKKQK